MEREGEGRGVRGRREGEREKMRRGRRRGGGEKMRGIIVGGIALLLVLGCNNGAIEELEKKNKFLSSVVGLGNEFLNVFTSFGDMISGETLGFKTESKKSEVRDYFKNIESSLSKTKTTLEKIVSDMKEKGNSNASGVETAVNNLVTNTIDKIIKGAKTASEAIGDDTGLIADFGQSGVGVFADGVDKLIEGMKVIVEVVLGDKGKDDAGDDKLAKDGTTQRTHNHTQTGEAGKLFSTSPISTSDEKQSANDAAKAVGAVTGADILKAMVKNGKNGDAFKLATTGNATASTNPKDATIAGAMALLSMAKKGKFANKNNDEPVVKKIVGDAAISAVTKVLDTLTIAIRKTIDEGLKKVKEAMKINANDNPITNETTASAK